METELGCLLLGFYHLALRVPDDDSCATESSLYSLYGKFYVADILCYFIVERPTSKRHHGTLSILRYLCI